MKVLLRSENLDDKKLYNLMRNPGCIALSDVGTDTIITVKDYVEIQLDETSPKKLYFNTWDAEPKTYATISKSFIEEFDTIHEIFGKVNHILLKKGKSKNNRNYITCVRIDEDATL